MQMAFQEKPERLAVDQMLRIALSFQFIHFINICPPEASTVFVLGAACLEAFAIQSCCGRMIKQAFDTYIRVVCTVMSPTLFIRTANSGNKRGDASEMQF